MAGFSFTKLFSSITESTIWAEPDHVRIVWITMLAMADRKGRIFSTIPGLAGRARVSVEHCEEALERFKSPDKYSRSKEFDGRRIEDCEGGWRLLNYDKYREMRDIEAERERKRKWAEKSRRKASTVDPRRPEVAGNSALLPQAEAEAEAEAEEENTMPGADAPAAASQDSTPKKVSKRHAPPHVRIFEEEGSKAGVKVIALKSDFVNLAKALELSGDEDTYRSACARYFTLDDKFISDAGYPGRLLLSRIQKVLSGPRRSVPTIDPAENERRRQLALGTNGPL